MCKIAIIAVGLLVAQMGEAQTNYTWTQAAGGTQLWSNASNWSGGVVPDPVAGDTIQANLSMSDATILDLGADRTFEVWTSSFGGFKSSSFTINSGYTITLAGTTPTITHNGKGSVTMKNVLAGTVGLRKNGSQTLELNNGANSFSGGIELAGGRLAVASDGCFGDAGNSINVTANSTLSFANGTYNRDISINDGVTLSHNDHNTVTISGAVTGLGGIDLRPGGFGTLILTLSSTNNTFMGPITAGNDSAIKFTVNSLADSENPITLKLSNKGDTTFRWGEGAIAPLVLNNRHFILSNENNANYAIENANTNINNTITINTDISSSRTTAGTLALQGVNTGDNIINGVIPDSTNSATISLKKLGSGKWVLAGENTYSGDTTISGGILALDGSRCLPDGTNATLTINGGKLQLNAGVMERVDSLILGSTPQTTNTSYGSFASSAEIRNDTYFAGTGLLFLDMDPPPSGSLLIVR